LFVKIRGDVTTHEGEEGRDGEGFVTVGYDLEIYGMIVVVDLKEA